jgi:dipeptidyl aminopeptidase/acylaminoacyl peptidase
MPRPVRVQSRDGLTLHGYLTLPPGRATPVPMVLAVHGGPWSRDQWGFESETQLLANRGYAVLQVNYRGSSGYGKAFSRAAQHEFAGAMHHDLLDAVGWAVQEGIADSSRVAIMGGSYGGYAALVGLAFTPGVFACGIDYAGPSNLVTLMEAFPPSWQPFLPRTWYPMVGNPAIAAERADLLSRSPIARVDSIRAPLLIFQGANDPRVTQAQSDAIAINLHRRGATVTYLLAANEGHSFGNRETSLAVNRAAELFLGACLGGRVQDTVETSIRETLRALTVDLDSLVAAGGS